MGVDLTFTRTVKVGGVATDADSAPLLRDSSGTFGVRRVDTGDVIVAAETVAGGIVHTGTGKYAYTLTGALSGIAYEAAFKFVVGGSTTYSLKTLTAPDEYLTNRALIESTGLINTDTWADANSDGVDAEIEASFARVVNEAQNAARAAADEQDMLASWPLSSSDPQYSELQRAATDFAVGRLQQIRPEPVTPGKEPIGTTGERVARQRMLDIWETIKIRNQDDGVASASAPVADVVTYFPPYYPGRWIGPRCG